MPRVAQPRAPDVPVLLVLVPDLGRASARAVAVRRPQGAHRDLVLVTSRTTPADLAKAIRMLSRSRTRLGERVPREMRAFVTAAEGRSLLSKNLDRARAELAALRRAPAVEVRGVGTHRALESRLGGSAAPAAAPAR